MKDNMTLWEVRKMKDNMALWEVTITIRVGGIDEVDASRNAREILADIDAGDETVRKLLDGDIVAAAAKTLTHMKQTHPNKPSRFYKPVMLALVRAFEAEVSGADWDYIYDWIELQSEM
jgi:hypothetical protein